MAAENVARPDGIMPKVPKGFQVAVFASGLERPREMTVAPDGTVFVSQTYEGKVAALRDGDGDGVAEMRTTFADGFREPSGLAVQDGALYVADWRVGFDGETMRALPRSMITRPGALGEGGGHITRELVFAPDVLFAPHSGPLGLFFARGKGFPPGFRGDAIVALHGSQTGGHQAGYELVRIRFRDGRPQGGYETFMTGFGVTGLHAHAGGAEAPAGIWGRPVWLAEAKDGALLVSDDVANVIWRVSWAGPSADAAPHGRGLRINPPASC